MFAAEIARTIGLLCAAMLVFLPPAATSAQPRPTDEEARRLFEAGELAYTDGRYDEALGHFRRAYELSSRAALLYNVGQAADRLRLDSEALDALERYLEASPHAENRRQVEVRISVLRRQIAMQADARVGDQQPSEVIQVDGVVPARPKRRVRAAVIISAEIVAIGVGISVGIGVGRDRGVQAPLPGDPNLGAGGIVQALRGRP